jgi:hypothetical protein
LPCRCEHGARHEETYFEIIDGLNKEKPMPEARSLRRLSPNCGPPFCPCARNGRMLTPITRITDEDDGGFHWTENLVRVLARYIIGLVTSTRGHARHGGVASLLCSRGNAAA